MSHLDSLLAGRTSKKRKSSRPIAHVDWAPHDQSEKLGLWDLATRFTKAPNDKDNLNPQNTFDLIKSSESRLPVSTHPRPVLTPKHTEPQGTESHWKRKRGIPSGNRLHKVGITDWRGFQRGKVRFCAHTTCATDDDDDDRPSSLALSIRPRVGPGLQVSTG